MSIDVIIIYCSLSKLFTVYAGYIEYSLVSRLFPKSQRHEATLSTEAVTSHTQYMYTFQQELNLHRVKESFEHNCDQLTHTLAHTIPYTYAANPHPLIMNGKLFCC